MEGSVASCIIGLGSASPALLRQSSESLAGRLETITLTGFSLGELGHEAMRRHWRRGGFPPASTADYTNSLYIGSGTGSGSFFHGFIDEAKI